MPLSEADLQQTNAVFREIKNTYPSTHSWTVNDLQYNPPADAWLRNTRKTRPRAGVDIPVTYEVRVDASNQQHGRAPVYIGGTDLTTQRHIECQVGSIIWK